MVRYCTLAFLAYVFSISCMPAIHYTLFRPINMPSIVPINQPNIVRHDFHYSVLAEYSVVSLLIGFNRLIGGLFGSYGTQLMLWTIIFSIF